MRETTTTQTVEEFEATQAVDTAWAREACEGATSVRVTRRHTPFGTFVVAVEPA